MSRFKGFRKAEVIGVVSRTSGSRELLFLEGTSLHLKDFSSVAAGPWVQLHLRDKKLEKVLVSVKLTSHNNSF